MIVFMCYNLLLYIMLMCSFTVVFIVNDWMSRNDSLSPLQLEDAALLDVSTSSLLPRPDHWEAPTFTRAAQFRVAATLVLFVFAAVSNLALLVSVCGGRGRRLASHLRPLIVSLVAADLMMTFVVMPLDMVWNVTVQWRGGDALCRFLSFLKLFAMQASASILVVISLDRHHAILHPLDTPHAHRRNRRMLLVAWGLSVLLASPQVTSNIPGLIQGGNGPRATYRLFG